MPPTLVRHRLTTPDGEPVRGRRLIARLIAPTGWLADATGEILEAATATSGDDGWCTLKLTPQSQIAATGSYYEVRLDPGTTVRTIVVPDAGPVPLVSCLVDPATLTPITVPPPTVFVLATDPRLADPRTPTPHAASHATGGSDPLTPAAIGAIPVPGDIGAQVGQVVTATQIDGDGKPSAFGLAPGPRMLPVGPTGDRFRNITVLTIHAVPTLSTFQTDLDYYQEWNYTTVTCDDVYNHLRGTATLPAKPLMVTFDDGYATQYAAAQELFNRGMKGIFYVTSGWIDGTVNQASVGFTEATALTWAQLQQMFAWGHDIQSHTVQHQDQQSLTAAQVAAEYVNSKARLEAQIPGLTVRHMAYPYGSWNSSVKTALIGAGCATARIVRCAADGSYPGPNAGRFAFATPLHDRYALPTTGTAYVDIMQPNFNHNVGIDEELIPDYGFEAGAKGWSLGSGFAADTTDKHSGTRSLTCPQGTSTVSATQTRLIPVGMFCRVVGEVWIKTIGLPPATLTKLQCQIIKPDGTTIYQTNDVVSITGNNGAWTKYTWSYTGDHNTGFLKINAWLQGSTAAGAGSSPTGAAWWDDVSLKRELLASPLALPY